MAALAACSCASAATSTTVTGFTVPVAVRATATAPRVTGAVTNCGGSGPRVVQWYAAPAMTARRPPIATHRHRRGRPELLPQRPQLRPVIADDLPDLCLLALAQPRAVDQQRERVEAVTAHAPAPRPLSAGTRGPQAQRDRHDHGNHSSHAHNRPP